MTSTPEISVSVRCAAWRTEVADVARTCRRAATQAFAAAPRLPRAAGIEISIVLADDGLVRDLNRDYRGVDKVTNVLAFPAAESGGPVADEAPLPLGDVVVAFETVRREASDQDKPVAEHLSHLIVHGVLHLLGFDHLGDEEAERMEALEVEVLAGLGIPDPYRARCRATR